MSACKSPKTELVAIYRLEFYKKQKNWKLYSSRHNKKCVKKRTEEKRNLNTTYNVKEGQEREASDPLNVAFVDSASDCTSNPNEQMNNIELSQAWQEPISIRPKSDQTMNNSRGNVQNNHLLPINSTASPKAVNNFSPRDALVVKPSRNCAMTRLQQLVKAAKLQEWADLEQRENAQNLLKESEFYHQELEQQTSAWNNNYAGTDYNSRDQCFCEDFGPEDTWLMEAGVMVGASHMAQGIWSEAPEDNILNGNCGEDAQSDAWLQNCVSPTGTSATITADLFDTEEEDLWEQSTSSSAEFMRGAHAQPHSSEIELTTASAPELACGELWRLSPQQLLQSTRAHSLALRRLLRESEQRQVTRLRSCTNVYKCNSFDDNPTRDVDSAPPPTPFRDVFVAGSHLQGSPLRGRGRGRLAELGPQPFW